MDPRLTESPTPPPSVTFGGEQRPVWGLGTCRFGEDAARHPVSLERLVKAPGVKLKRGGKDGFRKAEFLARQRPRQMRPALLVESPPIGFPSKPPPTRRRQGWRGGPVK